MLARAGGCWESCRGTARSWLELVMELGEGCSIKANCVHLWSSGDQKGCMQGGTLWAHIRANHGQGGISCCAGLLPEEECCIAREPLQQLGEFSASFCMWLLVYL